MRLMYEAELKSIMSKDANEMIAFGKALVDSGNAGQRQMASELTTMLRRSKRGAEAVEIARYLFNADPRPAQLNMYFVAVVEKGDIKEILDTSQLVDDFLQKNGVGYQKHIFATWLKAANRIEDGALFNRVFEMIPSSEKLENPYIISQYYVYLNRCSRYHEVVKHYDGLAPHMQRAQYVQKYYINACQRLNLVAPPAQTQTWSQVSTPAFDYGYGIVAAEVEGVIAEKKIFVVHGHDDAMLAEVCRNLERLRLPVEVLKEAPGRGCSTIIEEFEQLSNECGYAIILCSPDDEVSGGKYYCRQNVIFEFGYFAGKIGRENISLLYREKGGCKPELPSDVSGVRYISYSDRSWLFDLAGRLKLAGFEIDLNMLF